MADRPTLLLAVVVVVLLPLALGHVDLAVAGAGGLAALWWTVRRRGYTTRTKIFKTGKLEKQSKQW